MAIISLSIDDSIRKDIDIRAKQAGLSRSAFIESMIRRGLWQSTVTRTNKLLRQKFEELNLETYDDIENYLEQ